MKQLIDRTLYEVCYSILLLLFIPQALSFWWSPSCGAMTINNFLLLRKSCPTWDCFVHSQGSELPKKLPLSLYIFIGKLLEEESPKIRVGLWSTNYKDLLETKGHVYGGTKAGHENTFLKLESKGWGSARRSPWSPAWFFSHWPNRFKIYHSLSWIVNSPMNQNSHSFGNNTHSVENKDIFFFSLLKLFEAT